MILATTNDESSRVESNVNSNIIMRTYSTVGAKEKCVIVLYVCVVVHVQVKFIIIFSGIIHIYV